MEEFVLQNDPARMNWVEGYIEWGTVRCAAPLRVETEQVREGDILRRQVAAFTVDTSSAQPRFSGGTGAGVDDAVYALGWALEAADQRRRVARIIIPTVTDDDTTDKDTTDDDEVTTVQFH